VVILQRRKQMADPKAEKIVDPKQSGELSDAAVEQVTGGGKPSSVTVTSSATDPSTGTGGVVVGS
jgi:hypothetical protein